MTWKFGIQLGKQVLYRTSSSITHFLTIANLTTWLYDGLGRVSRVEWKSNCKSFHPSVGVKIRWWNCIGWQNQWHCIFKATMDQNINPSPIRDWYLAGRRIVIRRWWRNELSRFHVANEYGLKLRLLLKLIFYARIHSLVGPERDARPESCASPRRHYNIPTPIVGGH